MAAFKPALNGISVHTCDVSSTVTTSLPRSNLSASYLFNEFGSRQAIHAILPVSCKNKSRRNEGDLRKFLTFPIKMSAASGQLLFIQRAATVATCRALNNFPGSQITSSYGQKTRVVNRHIVENKLYKQSLGSIFSLFLLTGGIYVSSSNHYFNSKLYSSSNPARSVSMTTQAAQLVSEISNPPGKVVVIGGGLAGLSASVEIIRRGGSVVILEKCDRLGGNSAKASSGINAALSQPQKALGLFDSLDVFKTDTVRSGKGLANSDLVDVLVSESASAIDFLQEFHINLTSIARLGGHTFPRTHRAGFDGKTMNVGYRIMSELIHFVDEKPIEQVEVHKRARATQLLFGEDGKLTGVRCEIASGDKDSKETFQSLEISSDAVVLATGGYCADKNGLLEEYVPQLKGLATTNGNFATGDGVRLAKDAGAGLVDMDQVQLHPTAFVDPSKPSNPSKFLAPEALRGCGGILLNQSGKRFVNELATRDKVVEGILKNCGRFPSQSSSETTIEDSELPVVAYLVLNNAGVQLFDKPTTDFYVSRGLIQKFENAREFCRAFELLEENVISTLDEYGRTGKDEHPESDRERQEGLHMPSEDTPQVDHGHDPFGKNSIPTLFRSDEEIYVAIVTPALHYCMGGLKFSTEGQILTSDGNPISGLYGAGEVTGGLHGGNRLAGNSLLECVVYGRIAGLHAWDYVTKNHMESAAVMSG